MTQTKQDIGDKMDLRKQTEVVIHPKLLKGEYPEEELKKSTSLTAKVLTKELWEKLKNVKTKNGFTLARAVNSGVKNSSSLMGCHAGDLESWSVFKEFFDPCIHMYHNLKPGFKHPSEAIDVKKLKGKISDSSMIKTTRIRVARNIEGFQLAPGQNELKEKLAVETLLKKCFDTLEGDLAGTYYSLDTMKEEDRQRLILDHFLFKGNDKKQADSGYHKWFPKARGIFHNKDKTFLMWVNEGDHLRIISMEKGGNVRSVFGRLGRAIAAIEKALLKLSDGKHKFMKTDRLGNITCCPTNLGTGLRGGVHINLPKLAKKGVDELSELGTKHHIQARGIHGEHSKSEGGVVDLSNKYRLGYSENQLVQFMIDGINAFIKMEKESKE